MSYALLVALTKPGSTILLCTLTLKNTKKLYWSELMKMGEQYGLGFDRPGYSHNTDGWLKLENGSIIMMAGAETYTDVERLRGPAYDLILLDECASFNIDVFNYLIEDALIPAIGDTDGTIVLGGTPGDTMVGAFFEATYPHFRDKETREPTTRAYAEPDEFWLKGLDVEPLWSRHHWTQEQNVARPNLWANSLRRKKAKRWADDNPTWLQEYLGQWTPRSDSLVYALAAVIAKDLEQGKEPRCYYKPGEGEGFNEHGLPLGHHWRYMLGVDLGWTNATAFLVVAYSETFPSMRVVHQFKESHMIISRVAEKILELDEEFDFEVQIADTGSGGGKQIVETMNEEHGTDLIAANKTKKQDFQRLLNSDIWDGKIQMAEGSELALEMLALHWDMSEQARADFLKKGKLKEPDKANNHLCDCLLYSVRWHQAGAEIGEEVEDPHRDLSFDERQEIERIKELRRAVSKNSNAPFGEHFSDSMEPDSVFDQGSMEALGGRIFF